MWKFKPFGSKESVGLEGRTLDIGGYRVQVKGMIAEGGFSSVYLARDATNGSKQYAVKHIVCNDEESLGLVTREISVMKALKGHPNSITLYSDTVADFGRGKEALLLMEYCDRSLVGLLESRGTSGFFDEKRVLSIFRDVCNAVFAMHSLSPPVAHRDLKVENVLFGSDSLWKLGDFGSSSTNHRRFERPEEMGIEEDNIRKHTTPAYRPPEMWDLLRRDVISEKVDIWALGCVLFRLCYLKSAFDGQSKLQVLNGNYRIPQHPTYGSPVTDLIRDMLSSSPDARPDISQVWFRINEQLPSELQKSLPDGPPGSLPARPDRKGPGAFWSTVHAVPEDGSSIAMLDGELVRGKEGDSESAELARLREDLRRANLEKAELVTICRSQRHEIKGLKKALALASESPSAGSPSGGGVGMGSAAEGKSWRAFTGDAESEVGLDKAHSGSGNNAWGFGTDSFTARPSSTDGHHKESKGRDRPSGWAGF